MAEIRTIFWDIGGVLLTNGWDHGQRTRVLTGLGLGMDELAAYEARHEAANYTWERGLSTARDYFDKTLFYKPQAFTFEELWPLVQQQSQVKYPASFEVLAKLAASKKYSLATLNNESRELNDYRVEQFELDKYFGFFVCSGYVGEMKPLPGIYKTALEIAHRRPETTIFIDDKQENADAATALGMHGVRFTGDAEVLVADLNKLGVEF